jgi:hypothetical protein
VVDIRAQLCSDLDALAAFMTRDTKKARQFIQAIDLSGTSRRILPLGVGDETGAVFDQTKAQAQISGSALFSFAQGVTAEVREAISQSALLAQLVANKEFPSDQMPLDWFRAYGEVLQNLGWTLQDRSWTDYTAQGNAVEVHQKIIEVLTIALGPAPAALAVVTATISALSAMNSNSPWITLFEREAKITKIARFQIGLVDRDANGDIFVSLFAFLIQAQDKITQLLFFKYRSANATFQANAMKVSIDRTMVTELGPSIRGKIRIFQADYLSNILDLNL